MLDHADYTAPTRQRDELDHADHGNLFALEDLGRSHQLSVRGSMFPPLF